MVNSPQQKPDMSNPQEQGPEKKPQLPFPVVGIGASAGGLAAFEAFFSHLPGGSEPELAFVLVQHLSPNHKSLLAELVQRFTPVPVATAVDGMAVQAGNVYVIPPNHDLAITGGKLRLTPPVTPQGVRLPIDFFFRSLAEDQGELAVGIILSGTGTDGTQGLKSIKEVGGLAIVQTPETAEYAGMPSSALAVQQVDYVLSPDQMPYRLWEYARLVFSPKRKPVIPDSDQARDILEEIFQLLSSRSGIDFTLYKQGMTVRRIERRMAIHLIRDMRDYLAFLQQTPAEVKALLSDLLIGVTSFFRNPEAFGLLQAKAIPQILQDRPAADTIRVWVPACSTGEEAYSIAILFHELMNQRNQDRKIQIFATDVDSQAIAVARRGVYPENIALDLTAERLERFFIYEDNHYAVRKSIRELLVFAEHNLIESPPFTQMDLISCRNLLIYLSTRVQKKLLPLFRYALREKGFLFLGSAEGIGGYRDLFTTVDRKWKLYQSKGGPFSRNLRFDFTAPSRSRGMSLLVKTDEEEPYRSSGRELVEKFLLKEYTPPCVVINEQLDILYVHGHTRTYLEPPQGEVSNNLMRMVLPGLRVELDALIREAAAEKSPARRDGLHVKTNGEVHTVNLAVYPVEKPAAMQGLQIVVFQETGLAERLPGDGRPAEAAQGLALQSETTRKEEYLQVVEELESANQELKSKNEEMQAMYEELQSSNEEMEMSREELQSVNEELNTVNTELQSRLDELALVSNDMKNLLTATGIATLFLDRRLNILRFTPASTRIIKMIPGDIGRPVSDIVSSLAYDDLIEDIEAVLDTLTLKEVEVQDKKGAWYLLRILPYRTLENVIEGVVITFIDITEQKRVQAETQSLAQQIQEEREFAESIVATVREPLVVLNQNLKIISANRSFYRFFQVVPADTIGFRLPEISRDRWNLPELIRLLQDLQGEAQSFEDHPVEVELKDTGKRRLLLNARKLLRAAGKEHLILLAFEPVDGPAGPVQIESDELG